MQSTQNQTAPIRTWKPTVAGILEVVDGAFSIIIAIGLTIGAIVMGSGASWMGIYESDVAPMTLGAIAGILTVLAVVVVILAVLEIVGGISALQRKRWGLALAGGIATAIPGNVIGILAIIFLGLSKEEFT